MEFSYSSITEIKPGTFINLPKLRHIELQGNQDLITLHQKSFYGLSRLEELDLRDTGITETEVNKLLNLQNIEICIGISACFISFEW